MVLNVLLCVVGYMFGASVVKFAIEELGIEYKSVRGGIPSRFDHNLIIVFGTLFWPVAAVVVFPVWTYIGYRAALEHYGLDRFTDVYRKIFYR